MKTNRLVVSIVCGMILCAAAHAADFGAYYTKIDSGQDFEQYSRTGKHADIMVRLEHGKFVFWRGSSYLPYWQTDDGKWFVPEIVEREGDGPPTRPDKVNTYSRVKIIESSPEKVVILWRYLPKFEGTNPHLNATNVRNAEHCPALPKDIQEPEHLVKPENFVEEVFTIRPDGSITRTFRRGTEKLEDWHDSGNRTRQELHLTSSGIEVEDTRKTRPSAQPKRIRGAPTGGKPARRPAKWWRFDEGKGGSTIETVGKDRCSIAGPEAYWRKGVSGTALAFDGYETEITLPAQKAPEVLNQVTLEGWVAVGAYPWNWRPVVQQGLGDERSYALEVGPFGHVRFGVSLDGSLKQVKSEKQLERKRWYHLAGVYDGETGRLQVFVDGEQCADASAPQARITMTNDQIHIGKGRDMVPADAIRPDHTFADSFSFDGLLDEVRIYDKALSPDQIRESYEAFGLSEAGHNDPDLEERALPSGKETNSFGAYYMHFPFYETWDGMFRFGPYPDVMVEFDRRPTKFAFWRGTCFIPMLVNDRGYWYSNEFNETWGRSGGLGCQEPMSDKESFSNHARIIENTPARVVVQWRYPLVDVLHTIANFNEKTGWGDWSSWYYYIYPDGVAVKRMRLWSTGPYNHEWHEAMAILGPDQHPEDVLETDPALELAGLDGTVRQYSWTDGPPHGVNYSDMKIHLVNYSGQYDPFTIGDFTGGDVYGGEVTDYSVFPAWNHWPVGQMPSDGRYTTFPDRTAHSSLTHVRLPVHEQQSGDRPYQERLLMEGMTNKEPDELTDLAKSWLQPAKLQVESGAASGGYDRSQRAYLLAAESSSMKFTIEASPDSPIVNPCLVIRNWGGDAAARVQVHRKSRRANDDFRQGTITDVDGTQTKIVWLELESTSPVTVRIRGATPKSTPANEVAWTQEPETIKKRIAVEMEARVRSGPGVTGYYFDAVNAPESADSGWQDNPRYTAQGLLPGKTYRFRVKVRNRYFKESDWSRTVSVKMPEARGPEAHWKFDERSGRQVKDSAGSHDGEVRGEFARSPEGQRGGCLEFDGETEVRIDNADQLQSERSFTWTAWIRTEHDGTVIGRTGAGDKWERGGKVLFIRNGRLCFDVGWVGDAESHTRVDDGRWHHVTVAVNSPEIRFYVDGRAAGGGRLNVAEFDETRLPVKIGYCNRDFPEKPGFKGAIDDVRWYGFSFNRVMVENQYRRQATRHESSSFCGSAVPNKKVFFSQAAEERTLSSKEPCLLKARFAPEDDNSDTFARRVPGE